MRPGVGITWYDRGGRYWARRVALTLMWAVVLLLIVLIDVGIFTAIHHSSPGTAAILLTIDVIVAIAVLGYRIGCQCAGLQAGGEGGRT